MEKHLPNVLIAVCVLVFCSIGLWISRKVRPDVRDENGHIAFDGGDVPEGRPWVRISAQYHLLLAALVLLVVPIFLLFPSAVDFRAWIMEGQGGSALLKLGILLVIISTALAYSWKRGDLNWRKDSFQQHQDD